jgi:NADPH-dependent 2,4-dienoyl-CoA reductase/sulfur reductase-like enzyme
MATHAVPAVIGSGFIAMEVSSVLAGRGLSPVMVFPDDRVWKRLFTPGISRFFEHYFMERGVRFEPNETVVGFRGHQHVQHVLLKSGRELPCRAVVAGVGAVPVLDLARDAGLAVGNGVVVNEYLETSVPGVYAAGDIASYPDVIFNRPRRAEHWDNAVEHGKHLAHVLTGDRRPFRHVPYFFSDVFDLSYEYWGDSSGAASAVTIGAKDEASFSTWWLDGEGRVLAAFVLNRPDEEREAAVGLIEGHEALPEAWAGGAEEL